MCNRHLIWFMLPLLAACSLLPGQSSPQPLERDARVLANGSPILRLRFSPDGQRLISYGAVGDEVHLWDLSPNEAHQTLIYPEGSLFTDFSPDGRLIATIYNAHQPQIQLLDALTYALVATLEQPDFQPTSLAFSPSSQIIAISGFQRWNPRPRQAIVYLWHWQTDTLEIVATPEADQTGSIQFSPDGRLLAFTTISGDSCSRLGPTTLEVWDVDTQTMRASLPYGTCAFSPDNRYLILGTTPGACLKDKPGLLLVDLTDGKALQLADSDTTQVAFSPDGKYVIAASAYDQTLSLWHTTSRTIVRQYAIQSPSATPKLDFAFLSDAVILAVGGYNGTIEFAHIPNEP